MFRTTPLEFTLLAGAELAISLLEMSLSVVCSKLECKNIMKYFLGLQLFLYVNF